ncbi:hypothetical protein KKH59_05340 [Patescibacteria group bacterium]|nr:hypothetical protein [Patescibacteria group bacterium]
MRIIRLNPFKEDYKKLPPDIQKRADEKITFLITNSHHPSLRTKKIQGTKDVWEGRITKSIRFTFQITEDIYILRRIGKHDEVLRKP